MYAQRGGRLDNGGTLPWRERQFWEKYPKSPRKQEKEPVSRGENKPKRRKKKNRP